MLIQNLSDLPSLSSIPNLICVDVESETTRGGLEGFSFAYKRDKKIVGYYIPVNHYFEEFPDGDKYKNVSFSKALAFLKRLCKGRRVVFHNAQFDMTILEMECDIRVPLSKVEDTMLIHWLLNTERKHGLKPIMNIEYGKDLPDFNESRESFKKFAKYGEDDAKYTLWLFYKIYPDIKKRKNTFSLYRRWEIGTIPVLQDINHKKNFIRMDRTLMSKYYDLMGMEIELIKDVIREKLGDINYNSTKQLAEKLLEAGYKLKRRDPTPKMIATAYAKGVEPVGNYKLDEGALVELHNRQGGLILSSILYNRGISKLYSTYIRPIFESLEKVGNVYVLSGYDLMHTGTRTGRFSGHNPNLQNQPRESVLMKLAFMERLRQEGLIGAKQIYWTDTKLIKWLDKIADDLSKPDKIVLVNKLRKECSVDMRRVFIPMPGRVFIGSDYSQLELRMVAHLAPDEVMIDKFNKGADIHQETSDDISAIVKYLVTRQDAKPLNFGLVYGLYWTTLAAVTGMPKQKAKEVWEAYFELYYGVTQFIKDTHKSAKKSHFVQTLLGRRRNMDTVGINDYEPQFYKRRKNAENSAVSTIVSGSSSDLIKIATVNIYNEVKDIDIKLQIHDELLIEVDKKVAKQRAEQITKIMESAMRLKVPLVCDTKIGNSWRAVH